MSIEEINGEIEDLLFHFEVNDEFLVNEKIKYLTSLIVYTIKLSQLTNYYNYTYNILKMRNMALSFSQLFYETDTEQLFLKELSELLNDPAFVYIYEGATGYIEEVLNDTSNSLICRDTFYDEYVDKLDFYIDNGGLLEDSVYLSCVDKEEYDKKIIEYKEQLKLVKTKK